eukprot:252560_1
MPLRLSGVTMRPSPGGARAAGNKGVLECHVNGLRFQHHNIDPVDLIYANIKHALFVPAKEGVGDTHVIIHFVLKHAITIGKAQKKITDVQFVHEFQDAAGDNVAVARFTTDEAAMQEEQQQRDMIKKFNGNFRAFCQRMEKERGSKLNPPLNVELAKDAPRFFGSPEQVRETVELRCFDTVMGNVSGQGALWTMDMNDVEVVFFEGTGVAEKSTVSMIAIHKDYKTFDSIDSIYKTDLPAFEEWITSARGVYFELPVHGVNWKKMIKDTVMQEVELGGWNPWSRHGWASMTDEKKCRG